MLCIRRDIRARTHADAAHQAQTHAGARAEQARVRLVSTLTTHNHCNHQGCYFDGFPQNSVGFFPDFPNFFPEFFFLTTVNILGHFTHFL